MRVVNCSEPERFQPAGYWASQGLETEEEVRRELLWQAATSDTDVAKQTLAHAEGCDYCGDIVDRFLRVKYAMQPGKAIQLAICPAAEELVDFLHKQLSPEVSAKIASHVKKCDLCSGELRWLDKSEKRSTHPVIMTPRAKMITLLAMAATLLIGGIFLVSVKGRGTYIPIQDKTYSARYRNLARLPQLNRTDLIQAAPPSHWATLDRAMSALELGDTRRAVSLAARLINAQDEPAAEYVLGRALYRQNMLADANEALLKAERMGTPSPYRCWTALQIGLILGDKDTVLRECKHLENSPDYGEKAKAILEEVMKRG
jgi:hypothetical protein